MRLQIKCLCFIQALALPIGHNTFLNEHGFLGYKSTLMKQHVKWDSPGKVLVILVDQLVFDIILTMYFTHGIKNW